MSALSNKNTTQEELFIAGVYARSFCANTKMIIPDYIEVEFQSGWKHIVETLINKVKNYSINITKVTDSYSQLDISFKVVGRTKELLVWKAIEEARQASRTICACCGNPKDNWKRKGSVRMFVNHAKNGSTGTRLDKY